MCRYSVAHRRDFPTGQHVKLQRAAPCRAGRRVGPPEYPVELLLRPMSRRTASPTFSPYRWAAKSTCRSVFTCTASVRPPQWHAMKRCGNVAWIDRRHNPLDGAEGYPGGGDSSRGIEPSASLYYARSLDGGSSFEKNRYVTGLVCACCQIAVGFSKGNVILAWRSVEPGDVRDIFTTVSSDKGATWAKPQLASRDNWVINGCPHEAPTFASTASAVYLAWMTAASDKQEIYMVVSKDGGKTFGERVHVSAGCSGQ